MSAAKVGLGVTLGIVYARPLAFPKCANHRSIYAFLAFTPPPSGKLLMFFVFIVVVVVG